MNANKKACLHRSKSRDELGQYGLFKRLIGLVGRMFANGPRDRGSIPGRVIPKTQKMVFDAALLNTQHYKVRIKGRGAIQGKE